MRGNNSTACNNARGFTLVELLLALGISAMVAALAYAGISTAIAVSGGMQDEVRRLGEVQRALNILEEDLAQVVPRAGSTGYGSAEAVFRGGRYEEVLLEFTRGGVANPQGLVRSELQRVRYVLAEGRLWRQWWTLVDRADASRAPEAVVLLADIETLELGFLAPAAAGATPVDYAGLTASSAYWETDWNSQTLAAEAVAPLPLAVDLRLMVAGFGEVRRVVELP